jgi:hypothetical protein
MKRGILFFVSMILLISFSIQAQSDYEKTQSFKIKYKQLEEAIKNATSLDECNSIGNNIMSFKIEFQADKSLLDKALYPENFETSFLKLEADLQTRKGDFTQIVQLSTEVGTLKTQVTELSEKNQGLIQQIRLLNLKVEKDAATINSLQKLVAQLKSNIQQRDLLVRDIVDSLLAEFVMAPSSLNEVEKQNFISKVDSRNLFYNVERTINDNIEFIKVTQLTPNDLSEMKNQYKDFNKVWKQIGPRLADVYLNVREKASQIANIDNMFLLWNQRINLEIWGQINKLFREKKISLLPFNSGDQFVNSVSSFVDDEVKNLGVKSSDETERAYSAFTDSVYFPVVQPTWVPILIENNMMTEANKDTIEARIAMWKEKVAPASIFNWVYLIGGIIIAALIIAYFLKGRKKASLEKPLNEQLE